MREQPGWMTLPSPTTGATEPAWPTWPTLMPGNGGNALRKREQNRKCHHLHPPPRTNSSAFSNVGIWTFAHILQDQNRQICLRWYGRLKERNEVLWWAWVQVLSPEMDGQPFEIGPPHY